MNINILLDLFLGFIFVALIIAIPFNSMIQATTLWAGKKIAPSGMDKEQPTGFQDAITPKFQDTLNLILPICYVLIFVVGSFEKWYLGIVVFIAVIFVANVARNFFPNKIKPYLKIVIHSMDNKMADYVKTNDTMRAGAAKEISDQLHNLYLDIIDTDPVIPKFSEIQKMPLGS